MSSIITKPTQPQDQGPPPGNMSGSHPTESTVDGIPQPPASISSAAPCAKSELNGTLSSLGKHALDTTNAKTPAVTTSHLFDQVERLADLHQKVPVRFHAAIAKLIDLKLSFLRSNTKPEPACEDNEMLEELERLTKIKTKLVEGGIESQKVEPLIENKVRSLLILNGLFEVLAAFERGSGSLDLTVRDSMLSRGSYCSVM
ncbi:MAG: hypothetical protein Q9184_006560 [Pyrenodesmia sp. 2 TL-2023]